MNADATSIQSLIQQLFPLHRSQTGDGVRATFDVIREFGMPLDVFEIPTGEQVFDWRIPQEWRINDAFIKDSSGNRIVDYRESNLHVLNGSLSVDRRMDFAELEPFLYWHSDQPDAIPYRTAFFEEKWGFCVSQNQLIQLQNQSESMEVRIDCQHFDGSLSYAECFLKGESDETVVVWTHTCHPSLGNDNVSGIAASVALYEKLRREERKFSYRFVFGPATIGAIGWLARNVDSLDDILFGLVLCLLGDESGFTFKQTRVGNHLIDRCLELIASSDSENISLLPFSPMGYDERQFSSPGINLPFARISRAAPAEFPQYHTSGDCLSFISEMRILESVDMIYSALDMAEQNCLPINTSPNGEPCLGSRGLFTRYGDKQADSVSQRSILWTLNLSDGQHDALAISERSAIPFSEINQAIRVLTDHGLINL